MKFMRKLQKWGGFTLAEMLIVMAVVVVLAAAAIPSVANQVETAREMNDLDTIRAAYVDAFMQATADNADGTLTNAAITMGPYTWSQTTAATWDGIKSPSVGSKTVPALGTNTYIKFSFEADGATVKLSSIEGAASAGT